MALLILSLLASHFLSCNSAFFPDCLENENFITYANGSKGCMPCVICGPGLEPNITCGLQAMDFGAHIQGCRPCNHGYYSPKADVGDCRRCSECGSRSVFKNCTALEDTECRHSCDKGQFWDVPADACIPCCYCAKDKGVEYSNTLISKCILDDVNSGQHCAAPSFYPTCPEPKAREKKSSLTSDQIFWRMLLALGIVFILLYGVARHKEPMASVDDFTDSYELQCECGEKFKGAFDGFWSNVDLSTTVAQKCERRWRSLAKSLGLSDEDLQAVVSTPKLEDVFEKVSHRRPKLPMSAFVAVLKELGMGTAVKAICGSYHSRARSHSTTPA